MSRLEKLLSQYIGTVGNLGPNSKPTKTEIADRAQFTQALSASLVHSRWLLWFYVTLVGALFITLLMIHFQTPEHPALSAGFGVPPLLWLVSSVRGALREVLWTESMLRLAMLEPSEETTRLLAGAFYASHFPPKKHGSRSRKPPKEPR